MEPLMPIVVEDIQVLIRSLFCLIPMVVLTLSSSVIAITTSHSISALQYSRYSQSFLNCFPNSSKLLSASNQLSRDRILMALAGTHSVELDSPNPDIMGENDLLIVGPGVLGRIVAEKWKQDHPDSKILGQTVTSNHHEELIRVGIQPSLRGVTPGGQFPYVIFCAPPSRTDDYPGDIRLAASNWNGEGCFLFTSSTAVYNCDDNGPCDEDTPIVPIGKNPGIDVLLKAENVVQEVEGCTLRLAGLYKLDRGAHSYWLEKGTVPQRPDHLLNLIHYEDAASLAIAIMKKKFHRRTFLGCDNHPLTRQELMDIVNKSGKFSKKFEAFTGKDGPLGKRMNNSKTLSEIGWEPKYKSFSHFIEM